jgi:DNA-binding CsgD family transcriptional regulator
LQHTELSRFGTDVPTPASADTAPVPALVDALDRAQFGVIITAATQPPAFVNAYARRIVDRRDGLAVGAGGLEALQAADTRALRDTIDRACRRLLTECVTLMLPRAEAPRPFAVHVPAPAAAAARADLATVFICDPCEEPVVAEGSLTRLFGLTRAESAFAAQLIKGRTVEEAAAGLFISVHTARTHLKRILMKTDTGRQAELLRLLLTCSAQIRLE